MFHEIRRQTKIKIYKHKEIAEETFISTEVE